MPTAHPIQTNFTAGEFSPRMAGRVDIAKYGNSLQTMLNAFPVPHGPAVRRGGTEYINKTKDLTKYVRLIPFEFSIEQAYILEFGHNYIRYYKDHARIETAGITAITQANPASVTDTAHGLVTGDTVTIEEVVGMTTLNGQNVTVTVVDANTYTIGVDTTLYPAYVSGGISIVETTTTYGETELDGIAFVQSADVLYLVHNNHAPATLSRTSHTSWSLANITFTAPPASWGAGNYPGAISFFEQRLWFAGTPNEPQQLWASKSANYTDLTIGTLADDALSYTISTDQVNRIQWLSPGKVLTVGTVGGEFVVGASSLEEAITPTNVRVVRRSTYGSAAVRPATASSLVLFVQRSERKLREFVYDFQSDSYLSPDLTILAEHITATGIKHIAYQQEQDSIVWCVLNDGSLIGLTYQRDQEVVGWHNHQIGGTSDAAGTKATVDSVAVIPSIDGSTDEAWLVVKRWINGVEVRYLEVISQGLGETDSIEDSFFVDSGLSYFGAAVSSVSGLDHLEGETVDILADGSVRVPQVVTSGAVTISGPAAEKIHVGLNYVTDLKTQRFEAGSQDGTAQGKTKRISSVELRLYKTVGILAGPNADNLDRIPFRSSANSMDEAIPLFTGDIRLSMPSGWNKEGTVFIRQNQPLPLTLLAIMPKIKTNG